MMDQTSTVERNVTAFYDTVAPVISVDASGEYAVLGGLRGLNIIDLESPFKPARILHHHSQQSGTTVVRWNPKISQHNLYDFDACIISDYNKGVINNANIDTNILLVDPKKNDQQQQSGEE